MGSRSKTEVLADLNAVRIDRGPFFFCREVRINVTVGDKGETRKSQRGKALGGRRIR